LLESDFIEGKAITLIGEATSHIMIEKLQAVSQLLTGQLANGN